MQIDDLRDTLAIEITRILLTISAAKDFSDIEKILSRAYPLTDAVLAKRNVSRPVITKHEPLPSRNPERGKYPPKPPMPPDFERCIYIAMKELREDGKI